MKRLLLYLPLLVLTSCINYYEAASLDVLIPPQHPIDANQKTASIISNANPRHDNSSSITRQYDISRSDDYSQKISDDNVKVDSLYATCLFNFYNGLSAPAIFDSLTIIKSDKSPSVSSININNAFDKYQSDLLFVLEKLSYKDIKTKYHFGLYEIAASDITITTESQWRIYDVQTPYQPYHFTVRDTLVWEGSSLDRADCISQAIWTNAEKASEEITPYWKTVQRVYNSSMLNTLNTAERLVSENKWDDAAVLWTAIYESYSRNTRGKARSAFNMGLYYEHKHQLNNSLEWLTYAKGVFEKKKMKQDIELCERYIAIIEARIEHQKELDKIFN